MTVTVASLIARARSLSDTVNSTFILRLDEIDAVNEAYRSVYDKLCNSDDDFYITTATPSITGTYALPSDFYRLRAIDYLNSDGTYRVVNKFAIKSRNRFVNASGSTSPLYRFKGAYIYLIPEAETYTCRVWYYPVPAVLMPTTVVAWVTGTSYKIGDVVSNSSTYYAATTAHTAAALIATDISAGYWTSYATTVSTSLTYPDNLTWEIISHHTARDFMIKAKRVDKPEYAAMQQKISEFEARFVSQIKRDDSDYEPMNNHYGDTYGNY
jgi:hypothetical protein